MRISLQFVVLALALGSAAGAAEPPSINSLAGLSQRLKTLAADKARGYHQLLRDASHEVRGATLDRAWTEVEPVLQQQGLRRTYARDNQHTSEYRYLVSKDGWQGGDQTAHSLYLEFSVDRRSTNTAANAKPGLVMIAEAGLLIEPNRPYTQVLTNTTYPEGSVVFRGLRLPEVVSAAQSYPILKKIEVTYDVIRDRWSESVPQGFDLWVTLGDSIRDDRRGKSMYFTAPSGLDGLQDWQGRPLRQQFDPQDTVGEFRSWGGNEWKQTN
jgi:hypothetical protein